MQARLIDDDDDVSAARAQRSLRLVVPAQPLYATLVRQRFARFARDHGVPEAELAPFIIALGEALANAVEHAKTPHDIVATGILEDDRLTATVVDAGIGFAGAEQRVREARTPEPTAERGRGLALMRGCTDELVARSVPGQGTAVTLVRYLRRGRRRERLPAQRGG